jgi:hypothetical protein
MARCRASRRARAALLRLALGVLATGAAVSASAEELAALGGLTDTDDHTSASYAWGLEYRERLLPYLEGSLSYLNEGHLPNHHRDGVALQIWGRMPLWRDRVSLSVGVGPYVYFDTETEASAAEGYRDYHALGAVATVAASYALSERWFALLEISQIVAPGDVGTRTVLLGGGCRLDRVAEALRRPSDSSGLPNEIGVFFGATVLNGFHSDVSNTFGAEYRRRVALHVELSVSVLTDSDGLDGQHSGATANAWLVQEFLAERLGVGLGLGSYFSLQSYRTIYAGEGASVVGLVSVTASWRFTRALDLRLIWHRGFTGDDQDRDIVTAGLGWRF